MDARILLILFTLVSAAAGFFLLLKPSLAIEIQRRFYLKINWKMEPVSMAKEIRNTRLMGVFLICIAIFIIIYIFII
ncbi:MAG: hypothetical protein NC936_04210 [Candidatus Omnitrophica bacterium]|nr:hypothetical protein [Candidatus Omnitrophota bacterium]